MAPISNACIVAIFQYYLNNGNSVASFLYFQIKVAPISYTYIDVIFQYFQIKLAPISYAYIVASFQFEWTLTSVASFQLLLN